MIKGGCRGPEDGQFAGTADPDLAARAISDWKPLNLNNYMRREAMNMGVGSC